MTKNYFIGSLLPDLEIGQPAPFSFNYLTQLYADNLTIRENHQVAVIRRYYDIENLRALWKGNELDPRGLLDKNELEDSLFFCQNLPDYVFQFLDRYETLEGRLELFPELIASYYREESEMAQGFLKSYLIFERKLRLFQTAFRAFQLKRNCSQELHFENPDDLVVQALLEIKPEGSFLPPEEYEELAKLFQDNASASNLFHALGEYRFNQVQKMLSSNSKDNNSLAYFLGYLVRLIIVEELNLKDIARHSNVVSELSLERLCGL
jgi:hypothetical protein